MYSSGLMWSFQLVWFVCYIFAFVIRLAIFVKKEDERVKQHMEPVWTVTRLAAGMLSMLLGMALCCISGINKFFLLHIIMYRLWINVIPVHSCHVLCCILVLRALACYVKKMMVSQDLLSSMLVIVSSIGIKRYWFCLLMFSWLLSSY